MKEIKESEKAIAKKEGIKEGLEKGIREGIKEGLEKGKEEERKQLILNMKNQGFDNKMIAKCLNINIESLEKLMNKLNS